MPKIPFPRSLLLAGALALTAPAAVAAIVAGRGLLERRVGRDARHHRPVLDLLGDALDELLTRRRKDHRNVLIVLEGVYSQDGDMIGGDLPGFTSAKVSFRPLSVSMIARRDGSRSWPRSK